LLEFWQFGNFFSKTMAGASRSAIMNSLADFQRAKEKLNGGGAVVSYLKQQRRKP
jgi:hypothetical protein